VTVDETRAFKSDSLWNYELGTKTGWFDNRLTVDAAVFYIDWKDIQQNILLSLRFPIPCQRGRRDQQGRGTRGSLAPQWIPWNCRRAFGYQDAKIAKAGTLSPQRPGDPVFQVPDWTANASGTWTALCGPVGSSSARWTIRTSGAAYSANNLAPNGKRDLLNATPAVV